MSTPTRTTLLSLLAGTALVLSPLFVLPWGASAQEAVEPIKYPLLWRIETEPPSYLFGTIHIPNPRVTTLPDVVQKALDGADAVYTELKLDAHTSMKMQLATMLEGDQTLSDLLPKELYERVDRYTTSKGIPLQALQKMKIWSVEAQLGLLEELRNMAGAAPLDMMLYQSAKAAGKEVGGIEKLDEQLAVFEAFTVEEQIESLGETLDELEEAESEGRSLLGELIDLYVSGDDEKLLAYMFEELDESDEKSKAFLDRLLFDRNVHMAERCAKKIRENPGKRYFFAFGAAHFPGERGVVDLLEKDGFRVTRVVPLPETEPAGSKD